MDFRENLKIINKLYFDEEDYGCTNKELTKIENNLKIRFPQELKDFYITFGKNENLLEAMNNILLPNKLYIENNILVLAEENHNVCSYGMDVDSHKMFYLSNGFKEEIKLEIADFLIYIIALQGTGYLACVGELESKFIDIVKENFVKITKTEKKGAVFFDNNAILINTGDIIYICTKDEESMEEIENKYNLLVDYL